MDNKPLVIFDIDRTIYDGSIGQDFILELVKEGIISPKILAGLSFELIEYELDIQNYSKTVNHALTALANELEGKDIKDIKEVAKRVINYNHYKFYDYIFEIPALYKEFDYTILSLEPQLLVEEIANYLNIQNYISNHFNIDNDKVGKNSKIITDKDTLLEYSNFNKHKIITAFGDSENDLPIFEKSKLKIVVNPTPNLFEKISQNKNYKITNPKLVFEEFKKHIINFI